MSDLSRWALGGYAKVCPWSQCKYCGRAGQHDCQPVDCMLCRSRQCHGNGSVNGLCSVCHHGYLPGWSRGYSVANSRDCTRAGCKNLAVATARKRALCFDHAQAVKVNGKPLSEYVADRIANRDAGQGWERWRYVA